MYRWIRKHSKVVVIIIAVSVLSLVMIDAFHGLV